MGMLVFSDIFRQGSLSVLLLSSNLADEYVGVIVS